MILHADFVEAARQVVKLKEKFVLLSRRWDLEVTQPIEFIEGWQSAGRKCQNAGTNSIVPLEAIFSFSKIMLSRCSQIRHRSRRLGQLDDLQTAPRKMVGD